MFKQAFCLLLLTACGSPAPEQVGTSSSAIYTYAPCADYCSLNRSKCEGLLWSKLKQEDPNLPVPASCEQGYDECMTQCVCQPGKPPCWPNGGQKLN